MLYDCPHCGKALKRRLIRSVPAPGERKFLPSKVVQMCPECGGKIRNNEHPLERKLGWMLLPLILGFLLKDRMPSPKLAVIVLVACGMVLVLASLCVERRHLRHWQRYRRDDEGQSPPAV